MRLGSISAALSCLVYPPREFGEERGLLSRTAAGNRAYNASKPYYGRKTISSFPWSPLHVISSCPTACIQQGVLPKVKLLRVVYL